MDIFIGKLQLSRQLKIRTLGFFLSLNQKFGFLRLISMKLKP